MNNADKIKAAYEGATNYPNLAARLIDAGVQSYTVDVSSVIILYRFENGEIHLSEKTDAPIAIADAFDEALTVQTIRDNQQGKSTFPEFMQGIAQAGVRFYEATLANNPRVTYIGIGGFYEEVIAL